MLTNAKCQVEGVLADYGDSPTMNRVLRDVNVVIHAGAHKHVPICERNPLAAIINNVWGMQKLIIAAQVAGVQQFIQISTDKAVEPTSIMGATKRVCELIASRRDYHKMVVSVVRFGNVLGTDGSVIPLWKEQITAGGPLTLTSRQCTRFFMSIDNACSLVLAVAYMNKPGIFTFDMGDPVTMGSIADQMIAASEEDIEIKEIGLRPGEKLEEELFHGGSLEPTKHPKVFKVIEEGERQPSHHLVPDLVEHARKGRTPEAVETLWNIVNQAIKQ